MATQSVKDILNTEVPKPSFVLSPSVPAPLPSGVTVTRNGSDNVARTLDPYSGKFEHVPEDTPRVYGADQSLLVEAAGRTNHVPHSSSPTSTNWSHDSGIIVVSTYDSIVKGGTAVEVLGDGTDFSQISQSAGRFSGNKETLYMIIEATSSAKRSGVKIRDEIQSDTNTIAVDFDNETTSIDKAKFGSIRFHNLYKLKDLGPGGGPVYIVAVGYNASNKDNRRTVTFHPDIDNNDDKQVLHHAQLEEAPNASSPIVTGSSAKTRAGDDYVIPKGDWWNTKEGTFIFEFVPQLFYQPFDSEQFGFIDSNGEPTSYFNIYWADNPAPFEIQVQHNLAGPNRTVAPGTAAAFQKSTFACSFSNSGKLIVSLNGQSNTRQNTKATAPLLEEKDIQTGDASFVRYADISYLPRALPESTLNTLTT